MVKTTDNNKKTIFVSIVSYRDPECQHTVHDLFTKAKHPENIVVGIFWQCDDEADQHCFKVPSPYPKQMRIKKIPYQQAQGACYARSEALKLHEAEDFILQIDSHMRFAEGWDETLITMHSDLVKQGYQKPILTCYAPHYDLKGDFGNRISPLSTRFVEGTYRVESIFVPYELKAPTIGAFISGHFLFVKAEGFKEVPYDPHLFFMGEEVSLSVRFWTHGYDIFSPEKMVMYHLYVKDKTENTLNRPLILDKSEINYKDLKSKERANCLLGLAQDTNPENVASLKEYGLGSVRNLHQYELFSGINFIKHQFLTRAERGMFFPYWSTAMAVKPHPRKVQALSAAAIGQAQEFYQKLKGFCEQAQIKSVLDLNCGDQSLLRLNLGDLSYIGVDTDASAIQSNRDRFRDDAHKLFLNLDMLKEALPAAELIVARDLSHLQPVEIWHLLANIRSSDAKFILFDTAIDLTKAPFYLPAAKLFIQDQDKTLGLWKVDELRPLLDPVPEDLALMRSKLANTLTEITQKFLEAFGAELKQAERFFSAFLTDDWQACNNLCDNDPFISVLIKKFWYYEYKHILFRLSFCCDLEQLKERLDFITTDNASYAQYFMRDYLRNFMKKIDWNK